jgi:SAM-dependent methyltransferase
VHASLPSSHTALDQASAWVARFAPTIPSGEVLDLACGGGRHARLLASLGHPVLAVDRDADALARAAGQSITTRQIDLENGDEAWPFEPGRFAGIVVTNYLHRPLFAGMLRSLAPGGVLIYETFAVGNEHFGKPSNPLFLLKRGELLKVAANESLSSMHVVAYEDGYVATPKPAVVQRICVVSAETLPPPDSLPQI